MILRNAILSERRRMLEAVPRPLPVATQVARDVEVMESASAHEEFADLVRANTPEELPVREQRWSLESVTAWLAVQDDATRRACAATLADELVEVREAARLEGFAAGEQEARGEAESAMSQERAMLQALANSAEAAFERELAAVGDSCVDIVAEALSRIAGPLLATREAVSGTVIEVLRRVREGRELTIRVCPADLPLLQKHEDALAHALPGRKFTLAPDPRVDLGGCIVESRVGSLDGRLELQLRELYETLRVAKSAAPELS